MLVSIVKFSAVSHVDEGVVMDASKNGPLK